MVFKEIVLFTTLYKFPGRKMKCLKSKTNGFFCLFVLWRGEMFHVCIFETGSYVSWAGLETPTAETSLRLLTLCLYLPNAGVKSVYKHTYVENNTSSC